MDVRCIEDQSSDDEFFFGPLTLMEIKKRFIPVSRRQTVGYCNNVKDVSNTSFKLIETHSAPDVSSKGDLLSPAITRSDSSEDLSPRPFSDWDIKPDDSFLKLEQMMSDVCVSPQKHHESTSEKKRYFFTSNEISSQESDKGTKVSLKNTIVDNQVVSTSSTTEDDSNLVFKSPLKNNYVTHTNTPQAEVFKTPSNEFKTKIHIFKTPGSSLSHKKYLATPSRKYQNVASPVATYIRNCPQVPLVKDVCPKRPLPGVSCIPKPLTHISSKNIGNKENVNGMKKEKQNTIKLPTIAYRTAKETKVINIPEVGKMPQSQWAKQVASSIPRATVVKHNHREISSAKKPLQRRQEDSYADLSLHQADLSVCTQKSSLSKPKKNI